MRNRRRLLKFFRRARGAPVQGGAKHVTLGRFESYRPSCPNLTPTRATASGSALLAFFCKALEIEPRKLAPLPERAQEYLREAVAAARAAEDDRAAPVHEQSSSEVIEFMAKFVGALLDGTAGVGELLGNATLTP